MRKRRADVPIPSSAGDLPAWMMLSFRVSLVVLALVCAAVAYREVEATDDGGPPLGALCMAMPAVLLLLLAGATWPRRYGNLPAPPVRRAPGTYCTECGYDFSGDASNVCPTCGTTRLAARLINRQEGL